MDSFLDYPNKNIKDLGVKAVFPDKSRLPPQSIRHLLITAEHASFQYRGGIGSYAQEMESLLGPDRLGVFFVGEKEYSPAKFPSDEFLRQSGWIVPSLFFPQGQCRALPKEDLIYQCLRQIIPHYPSLEIVEIQDCDGWGVRITQAKRAGLLPENLTIKIRCHGTYVYLEQAHGKWWADHYHLRLMAREKQAIEQADCVSFPTDFLHNLYLESGYNIEPARMEKLRYPLSVPKALEEVTFQKADTLIFVGSRTSMKGFHLFADAVKMLLDSESGRSLKKILILGTPDPAMDRENTYFRSLKKSLQIKEASLPRQKVLEILSGMRGRAICVLPYLGDNHPNAVLEAMVCGCPLIAAGRGGIPELVPRAFHEQVLCEPDAEIMAKAITRVMGMKSVDRQEFAGGMREQYLKAQEAINKGHRTLRPAEPRPENAGAAPRKTVLMVLTENPSNSLMRALEQQTRKPDKIEFVSGSAFHERLKKIVEEEPSAIVLTLDGDYMPQPDFVKAHTDYLEANPQMAAVAGYCLELDKSGQPVRVVRPLGDGLLLNFYEDCLGHSSAGFSLSHISDSSFLENGSTNKVDDLFPAILSGKGRIGVIPEILSQRAARPVLDKDFSRGISLALQARNLPRFDALRLAGAMQDYASMQQTPAIAIARELENFPLLQRLGKAALEKTAKIYFKIKTFSDK